MTDMEAIIATMKHWREDYKKLCWGRVPKHRNFKMIFNTSTCALCQRNYKGYRGYKHKDTCGRCPLKPEGTPWCGCSRPRTPYSRAHYAYYRNDKPAFMAARSALLKRLQRALKRLEKSNA